MRTIFSQMRQFAMPHPGATLLIATALVFGFATNATALWPAGIYRFDAISGTVVDKETRKPIEGVVVVGHWGLETNTLMNSNYSGPLVVKEVVTDKDGKFSIPASVATDIHKRGHFNSELYPEIAFFKSGYDFTAYRHNGKWPQSGVPESNNTLSEDEYRMPKELQDRKARIDKMRGVNYSFTLTSIPEECPNFEIMTPLLLGALRAERARIAKTDEELAGYFAGSFRLREMESCINQSRTRRKP